VAWRIADSSRQPELPKHSLEYGLAVSRVGRFHALAAEELAAVVIGDGEGIDADAVRGVEAALEVGAPDFIGRARMHPNCVAFRGGDYGMSVWSERPGSGRVEGHGPLVEMGKNPPSQKWVLCPMRPPQSRIAEAVAIGQWGEKQIVEERPFKARLRGGVWTVKGTLHPQGVPGGTAVIQLNKMTGAVLFAVHQQ
jgi:hypothetical protein